LALVVVGAAVGGSLARAETPEQMARDLVPAQKPLYELGGLDPNAGLAIDAWVDRPEHVYAVGQQLRVFVRPKQTAYITVMNIGTSGRVAVIFPNFHQRDMQVQAGHTVAIPADGASWKIHIAGPPGIEVIKIIASKAPLNLPEILKLGGATAAQPILSLGRSGEEVARDLVPQLKPAGGATNVLPGGVRNLLVRVVRRGAAVTLPPFETAKRTGAFGLTLRPERPVYKIGESLRVAVGVEKDCNLTLVGVGTAGKSVRLFPNQFQAEPLIRAGQRVVIPSPYAPFEFKVEGPAGAEELVATCHAAGAMPLPAAAPGGFATIGGITSITSIAGDVRDLAALPVVAGGDVEQVASSFLVTD
jgi:hypothetical protein